MSSRVVMMALASVLPGCMPLGSSQSSLQPISSPDGMHILIPSVVDASVRFDVCDANNVTIHHVNTSAGDAMKWAIGWCDKNTIVLYSSDLGTFAWEMPDDRSIVKLPTPVSAEISDCAMKLYESKYGKPPRAHHPPNSDDASEKAG